MATARRLAGLIACSAFVLAVVAGGPGTVALFSDAHVAAGNISADADINRTSMVDAIGQPENASANADAENASTEAETENASRGNVSVENTDTNGENSSTTTNLENESAGTDDESANVIAGAKNGSANETTGTAR